MLGPGRRQIINQEGFTMKLDTVLTIFSLSIHIESSVSKGRSKAKASNLRYFQRSSIHIGAHVGSQTHAHTLNSVHSDRNVNLQPFLVSMYLN